jgi:cytochrome c peroxidase
MHIKQQQQNRTMKKLLLFVFAMFAGSYLFAQEFEYIGAAKCKMCHNKPETGKQYDQWKSTGHSKAFETLKSPEALKIAQEKGIADPSKDQKCLKCHATAAINADLNLSITMEEGVSCETCHGPGSGYKSMAVMKSREQSLAKGLIIPDEKLCKTCHNSESPTFKSFDFATASKTIAHPNPLAAGK